LPNILPLIQDLVKLYGNITAPPTTTPPSPPPSTQPGPEPRVGYDDPYFRSPLSGYWNYLPHYLVGSGIGGYGYGAWQLPPPPFGPPAIHVMPPVWTGWTMPTTTAPTYIITAPSDRLGAGQTRERGYVRETATDSGETAEWWWPTDRPFPKPGQIRYIPGVGFAKPDAYTLAASIQGYPLNAAAYGQFMNYYREMWDRYTKPSLPDPRRLAEGPPEWYKDLGYEEPEWWKDVRRKIAENLQATQQT
jgi:hypothetical protein